MRGASAKPIAGALPNAPMYAPRMSAGASCATTACDVGTHSISPITKTTITKRIAQSAFVKTSRRYGSPITSSASTSFGAAGIAPAARVSRTWKSETRSGLTQTRKPHAAGSYP